ncbi:hypothetical protein EV421DRAFT_1255229 [Armillaria borealis]|uniref:Uncharacterized protein n=1 Tax=Armillaria borealis TaxID=47425 RepID=A0AA39MIR4_9AGAR|nr:hypothetical protein EV421DRAFT_1255229 [Armillaria borealis]
MTPAHRSLIIHTRSKAAINAVVYLSPTHKQCGWSCVNADLLKNINGFLYARAAPTEFRLMRKGEFTSNNHVRLARGMSTAALRRPANDADTPILVPTPLEVNMNSPPLDIPKVTSDVSSDEPKADNPTASRGKPPKGHRGRKRLRAIQAKNKERLLSARSLRHWWKVVDDLGGRRLNDEGVTADQLYDVFKKRLNPPETIPPDFDKFRLAWDRMLAEDIPDVTGNH